MCVCVCVCGFGVIIKKVKNDQLNKLYFVVEDQDDNKHITLFQIDFCNVAISNIYYKQQEERI